MLWRGIFFFPFSNNNSKVRLSGTSLPVKAVNYNSYKGRRSSPTSIGLTNA